jgi:hypothetical protein
MYDTFLCVNDRKVWKIVSVFVVDSVCPTCGEPGLSMGPKWRPPKLTDEKSWKLIDNGDYLWDKRAIRRVADKLRKRSFKH